MDVGARFLMLCLHVCDLALAHDQALNYLTNGGKTIGINLGSGAGNSVLQIIALINRISGKKVKYRFGPRRAGDPPKLVANVKEAQRVLMWRPRMDIEEIISTALEWHTSLREIHL